MESLGDQGGQSPVVLRVLQQQAAQPRHLPLHEGALPQLLEAALREVRGEGAELVHLLEHFLEEEEEEGGLVVEEDERLDEGGVRGEAAGGAEADVLGAVEGLEAQLAHLLLQPLLPLALHVPGVGEERPEVQEVEEVDLVDGPPRHRLRLHREPALAQRHPHREVYPVLADGQVVQVLPLPHQLLPLLLGQLAVVADRGLRGLLVGGLVDVGLPAQVGLEGEQAGRVRRLQVRLAHRHLQEGLLLQQLQEAEDLQVEAARSLGHRLRGGQAAQLAQQPLLLVGERHEVRLQVGAEGEVGDAAGEHGGGALEGQVVLAVELGGLELEEDCVGVGGLVAEAGVVGGLALLVVVLLGLLAELVEVGDEAVGGVVEEGLLLVVLQLLAPSAQDGVEVADDVLHQVAGRHPHQPALELGVEGVEVVDLLSGVGEDAAGEEGGGLFGLDPEEEVGALDEEGAPAVEVLAAAAEGARPAQQAAVGVEPQLRGAVLLHLPPHLLKLAHALHHNYMDILQPTLAALHQHLGPAIRCAEAAFLDAVQHVDFPAFCLLYALLLLWLLRRLHREAIFRPKNRELIGRKERFTKALSTFFVSLPFVKQYVDGKFEAGFVGIEKELIADFEKDRDAVKAKRLPEEGMKAANLEARMKRWFQVEEKKMFTGKNSGAVYPESSELCKEVSDFAAKYMYHNPLHLDTYKEVGKMEAELLLMTASLVSKHAPFGVVTSGGSESLIMSLYAYRKAFPRARPNIVVPHSIHAALDKGAMYFNVEMRKARLNERYEVDVGHMRSLIDSNTIALYASYPNYPHGIIDPIAEVAALAKSRGIGCHVDGCLGGFVAGFMKEHEGKFSIDVEGVTSISLDHHKFGLAPKGISSIFFKTRELRQHMYFIYTDWVGGIYATPSFPGSRSGFASAGAWYSLTHIGRKQFVENALRVSEATKQAARELGKIEGVRVLGAPELCVVAFETTSVPCFSVLSFLAKEKDWKISAIHLPNGIHVSVTLGNCDNVRDRLAADVREAVEKLKDQPAKESSTAALYGASATLPSEAMGEEMLRKILSITYK